MCQNQLPSLLGLPPAWPDIVRSAMVQVISLAHHALLTVHGWAANALNPRARHKANIDRLRNEIALLREETRIKDARMGRIDARRRPHYPPDQRMAVRELKAARGWSLARTARAFLLAPATIASWLKRIDEDGPAPLVQFRQPVNKFPEFVRYVVQRLKTLCPLMGKVKIAQTLARAGLHMGATTVGRMLKEEPASTEPTDTPDAVEGSLEVDGDGMAGECADVPAGRVVTAKRPNHVWHVDLTVVPTRLGMWAPWKTLALPQVWPFCWWVAVAVDHFSRRAMGVAVFRKQPTSAEVRAFLGRAMQQAAAVPKYIICDKGSQFWCDGFKGCCKRKGIKPRFGAVGKRGSIAVVERFIRTLKDECTRRMVVPLRRDRMPEELLSYLDWYNEHSCHTTLAGRTPNEAYFPRLPGNQAPRAEPRPDWPEGAPCARPQVPARAAAGGHLVLEVSHHAERKHLLVVRRKHAA